MKPIAAIAVALGLVLAGCSENAVDDSARGVKPSPAAPDLDPAEQEAADVALRYIHAVAEEDWEAACATRTQEERAGMARLGGSCARGFEAIFKGKPTTIFATIEAGDVRIKGDIAGVDLVQPGQTEPAVTLGVVRENGEWLLEDMDDGDVP